MYSIFPPTNTNAQAFRVGELCVSLCVFDSVAFALAHCTLHIAHWLANAGNKSQYHVFKYNYPKYALGRVATVMREKIWPQVRVFIQLQFRFFLSGHTHTLAWCCRVRCSTRNWGVRHRSKSTCHRAAHTTLQHTNKSSLIVNHVPFGKIEFYFALCTIGRPILWLVVAVVTVFVPSKIVSAARG